MKGSKLFPVSIISFPPSSGPLFGVNFVIEGLL
jgi:hypothetical protein